MQTFLSTPTSFPSRGNLDLTPPPPPLLPPPRLPALPVRARRASSHSAHDDASDLTEEIRRSLENLDAIIQLHDDGGLTEQEMLNLPAPAPELLEFPDGSPQHITYPSDNTRRPPPPPAPPRRSSIKQQSGDSNTPDNGHIMTEEPVEEVGIDQSSRSVADILQKFSRANTPPKMPTVPPALRTKSISSTPDVVPPPAAFRSSAPVSPPAASPDPAPAPASEPAPPPPPPDPAEKEEEDFGFARLRKLAEMSSSTGEDVHKRGALQRSKTLDVTSSRPPPVVPTQNRESAPEPAPEPERRSSAPGADEEGENFAFARLRALAEQKSVNIPGNDDDDSMNDSDNDIDIDLSQVPGYVRIDARTPNWKRSMVEKKNKEAIEAYLKAKEDEEKERRKWANVPAWKRNLVQKKQKVEPKSEGMSSDGRKQAPADPNLPTWKRNLVERRKSGDEARR